MNYQHMQSGESRRVTQRPMSAAQRKKVTDLQRIDQLNRLTRYPSIIAILGAGVALASALVHVIR